MVGEGAATGFKEYFFPMTRSGGHEKEEES
jgi:hypothetical protein